MAPREQLLAALVAAPDDGTGWLALADCLEEEGEPHRAELTRLTARLRKLAGGAERRTAERRVIELLGEGVRPCVPEVTNAVGLRLAFVPPGRFRMGSAARGEPRRMEDEPLHSVRITRGFWLGVYPVTQAQFRAVTRRSPSHHGKRRVRGSDVDPDRFPVETVSWNDALEFCGRLAERREERAARRTYRLPTEAEWEYACRGLMPTRDPFHFGPALNAAHANFNARYPYPPDNEDLAAVVLDRPCEVGRYPPNAFGLYDMHGNVDEWCHDWYGGDYYTSGPASDPRGPDEGDQRIIRGGSWRGQGEDCRSAVRIGYVPGEGYWHVGFRVVGEILAVRD